MSAVSSVSPSTQPTFEINRAHLEAGLARWCEEKRYDPEYNHRLSAAEKIKTCYASQSRYLYLTSSHLTTIPPEIGFLTQLKDLYLDHNQIREIPPEIGLLTQLTDLYLDHNQIREIPPEIGLLTQLTDLNLSNNQIRAIPPDIGLLTQLRYLFLSNNQIREIPSDIGLLTQLVFFFLSNNRLTEFPSAILSVPAIKRGVLKALRESLKDERIAKVAKFTFLLGLEEPLPEEGYNLSSFKNDLLFGETTAVSEIFDFAFPQKIETIDWIEDGETTPLPVEEVINRLQAD